MNQWLFDDHVAPIGNGCIEEASFGGVLSPVAGLPNSGSIDRVENGWSWVGECLENGWRMSGGRVANSCTTHIYVFVKTKCIHDCGQMCTSF